MSWFEHGNIYSPTPHIESIKKSREILNTGLTLAPNTHKRIQSAYLDSTGIPPETLDAFLSDIVQDATYPSKGNLWKNIDYWEVASFTLGVGYNAVRILPTGWLLRKATEKMALPLLTHKVAQNIGKATTKNIHMRAGRRTALQTAQTALKGYGANTIDNYINQFEDLLRRATEEVKDALEDEAIQPNELYPWFDKRRRR